MSSLLRNIYAIYIAVYLSSDFRPLTLQSDITLIIIMIDMMFLHLGVNTVNHYTCNICICVHDLCLNWCGESTWEVH